MSDASRQARANKRKGADFEIDLLNWLRSQSLSTDRLTKTGKNDEGDLSIRLGRVTVVVECKNKQAISLSTFVQEAVDEAIRYETHRVHDPQAPELVIGVAAIKRRQAPIAKTYIAMEADDFAALLRHLSVSGR